MLAVLPTFIVLENREAEEQKVNSVAAAVRTSGVVTVDGSKLGTSILVKQMWRTVNNFEVKKASPMLPSVDVSVPLLNVENTGNP